MAEDRLPALGDCLLTPNGDAVVVLDHRGPFRRVTKASTSEIWLVPVATLLTYRPLCWVCEQPADECPGHRIADL